MPTSARHPPGPRHSAGRAHLHPHRRGGFYIRPKPGSIYPGPRWLRELGSDAPCAPLRGAVGDGAFDTSVRTGGYKIRPYRPALGFPVGAACMAARTGSRLPPGFDGPATPRVRGTPPAAHTSIHTVGADFISARNQVRYIPGPGGCGNWARTRHARPYGVRSAMVHSTRRCARADIKSAPTDPLSVFP